ncbi:MAG: putative toxin-antitoxin system toxin component, PIN family [Bacteroidales bacterium]
MDFIADTNILISAALINDTPPGISLRQALNIGNILFSQSTMEELLVTLNKTKLKKYIKPKDRFVFINRIMRKAIFVEVNHKINECRDPKDNKFLELALSGNADCIISGDEDLLILNPFRSIPILTANEFLERY